MYTRIYKILLLSLALFEGGNTGVHGATYVTNIALQNATKR